MPGEGEVAVRTARAEVARPLPHAPQLGQEDEVEVSGEDGCEGRG